MAMVKPIVLGVEGESAELVMSSGGGVCIEPENGKDLAHQLGSPIRSFFAFSSHPSPTGCLDPSTPPST